ncbi:MAG: PAS domain S-box protein [Kiritimatiellia bacterium]
MSSNQETSELPGRIFDSTLMCIAYLDTDFNFIRVNRAYADSAAESAEYFIGKSLFDLYPDEGNRKRFRKVRDTGKPFQAHEERFVNQDRAGQNTTYWDWSILPVKGKGGQVDGILHCLVDATERVRMRAEASETERKYRELVEYANSAIMRITPGHRITFFNEYAQSFFGYSAGEIIGRNVLGTIVPEVDSEGRDMRKMTREISAHPEIYASNYNENIKKDGTRVWMHWANRAVRDEYGNVTEILCVGTDITKRRQAEEAAEADRGKLRGLAGRLAVTEEQERRRIAAHIHDTIIQTLSLSSIRMGGVKASLRKKGVFEEASRLDGISSLLDEAIAECRGLMGELVPVVLYEVGLTAALRDFARKQSKIDGTPITVKEANLPGDMDDSLRGLLFQCARELVTNALKYAGSCRIDINVARDGDDIRLEVSDNGRGFDTAAADEDDDGEGGFGLFNIRERLEGLGGSLDIRSEPGNGTTAVIRVPAG